MSKCAVILAGGKGTRLKPYTIAIPKPLVPVGDLPVLEHIIIKLAREGFKNIIITVNHLADLIQAFFSDGGKWDVNIKYSIEDKPLSTMGPLKLIKSLPENFLILNGDVLTDLNFSDFFETHVGSNNLFTIATSQRKEKIDYGVLDIDETSKLVGFREKPQLTFNVSMGIYAANRRVLDFIPENEIFGFDDLMLKLIEKNETVNTMLHNSYWLDIGRPDDYEKAISDMGNKKL